MCDQTPATLTLCFSLPTAQQRAPGSGRRRGGGRQQRTATAELPSIVRQLQAASQARLDAACSTSAHAQRSAPAKTSRQGGEVTATVCAGDSRSVGAVPPSRRTGLLLRMLLHFLGSLSLLEAATLGANLLVLAVGASALLGLHGGSCATRGDTHSTGVEATSSSGAGSTGPTAMALSAAAPAASYPLHAILSCPTSVPL